ncbi:AsmA family protein [Vibrio sp. JC009]|uniref:AsmA family protein n=1 Tax=Vibrio sp. JC009 TaxID=2912314 RepID=UPI0023B0D006|nr:AsmA family protein [Vibrio sp. JC009]WED22655.1 AsmA family protein [Vibrio sp. JC009]
MKKLLLILGIPVALVVIAIAALVLFVNPNQFKPIIVEQTKAQTGLDLAIEGDINWSFFPSLGLSMGKTELKNPQGFKNENLLKIDAINVDVSVMPLLDSELYVGSVTLDGAEIYLETLKNGKSNLDSLTSAPVQGDPVTSPAVNEGTKSESVPVATRGGEAQSWKINLAGISITNALMEIRDDKAGSYTKLYDVGLAVSEFAFDQWTTATFEAKGQNNAQKFAAKGQAELKLAEDLVSYQLRNIELDSSFSDPATNISSAKVTLESFAFDDLSPLTVAVKGNAADMVLDVNLAATLLVDKAISVVKLDNIELKSVFEGEALPQSPMNINGKFGFDFQMEKQKLNLAIEKLALNDIELDGNANVALADIPAIRFDIHSPDIDLDEFLGLNKTPDTTSSETAKSGETQPAKQEPTKASAPAPEAEPDLSALKTLDIAGSIAIDKFKASNAHMQNVNAKFSVNRGVVTLSSFSSNLYEGAIKASAKLDGRKTPATYSVNNQITGVKVLPLLKDVAENEMLEGTGNIDVAVKGKSLTPTGIKQNLAGTVKINFADGAVNGINIAQIVRESKAKLKGEDISSADAEQKKTDFSALTSTITLSKGVAKTDDLAMASPFLRIKGKGETNYLKETMDFLFDTSIVGTSKGQGGKDIDELRDVTIPVRVYNKWTDPKYKVELGQLLKALEDEKKKELEEKAKKEAQRGLKKLLGDKAGDEETKNLADQLLKGLFN